MSGDRQPSRYRPPRLFVEAPLAAGVEVALAPQQMRYLLTVMRREDGADVRAFNGLDGEWSARIRQRGKRDAVLVVDALARPQPPAGLGPWLVFAAIKRGPTDLMVEKATELGAARLIPVRTQRANAERLNIDRLTRIARDAPEISDLAPLADVLSDWPADRVLVVADETGAAPPASDALAGLGPRPFGLLIGPEGGFAPGELDALEDFDFARKIGLGPRVLRAETAAIVGLALAQATMGDLSAARAAPE